jgi:hypothetical protein
MTYTRRLQSLVWSRRSASTAACLLTVSATLAGRPLPAAAQDPTTGTPEAPAEAVAPSEAEQPVTPAESSRGYEVYYLCGTPAEGQPRPAACDTPEEQACEANLVTVRRIADDPSNTLPTDVLEPDQLRTGAAPDGESVSDADGTIHPIVRDPCVMWNTMAVSLGWAVAVVAQSNLGPEVWQPLAPDTETSVGSGAQTSAIGSIIPSPSGGVTANYANAADLSYLVLAGSLNILALALPNERWAPRLMDVSAVLPVQLGDSGSVVGVHAVGARLRVDLVGGIRAAVDADARGLEGEITALGVAYADYFHAEPDPSTPCWRSLLRGGSEGCGAAGQEVLARARALATALDQRRRDLDLGYGGLDLRYDHGDPELVGNLPTESNSFQLAAVGGLRAQIGIVLIGGRARLGYRYVDVSGAPAERNQLEYGAAFEVGFLADRRAYRLSFGLDGSYRRDASIPDVDQEAGTLRVGVSVPINDVVALSAGIIYPFGDGATNQVAVIGGLEARGEATQ